MDALSRDQLTRVLIAAKKRRERDYVMLLVAYRYGLRASEIVGKKTRMHGQFDSRPRAEERAAEVPDSTIRETSRRAKRRRIPCFQVVTATPILSGGLTAADFADDFLNLKRLKGSRRTKQPLLGSEDPRFDAKAAVASWIEKNPGTGRLFPLTRQQVFRMMRYYCKQANVPAHLAHPHALKHSLGQHMVEAGATIPEVQAALGHTSIASTGIYTAVGDREGAAAMARAEQRQSDREQDVSVDSLGGVSAIEALRRVLRQLEHQEGKKKKPRKR